MSWKKVSVLIILSLFKSFEKAVNFQPPVTDYSILKLKAHLLLCRYMQSLMELVEFHEKSPEDQKALSE